MASIPMTPWPSQKTTKPLRNNQPGHRPHDHSSRQPQTPPPTKRTTTANFLGAGARRHLHGPGNRMFVPRVQGFQSRALVPVLLLLLAMRPAQPYPLPLSSRRRSPPYVTATGSSSSNAGGAAASALAGSGIRSATGHGIGKQGKRFLDSGVYLYHVYSRSEIL